MTLRTTHLKGFIGFVFYWSLLYNQAINHIFASVFRDYTEKDAGVCWSLPMSCFEEVQEKEQFPITGQIKSSSHPSSFSVFVH